MFTRIPKTFRLMILVLTLLLGVSFLGKYSALERVTLVPDGDGDVHINTAITVKENDGDMLAGHRQQRIIALAPHVVEMLFEIGAGENIIATLEHSDYPLQANDIPRVGNYARLKIEDIIAYKPDLIIAWRTGNPSDDLERLEKLGLNVVYSNPLLLSDVAKELRVFGQLTNNVTLAEQKAIKFENELTSLKQQYQHKSVISVFYELWSKPLTTIAGNAWPQQQLEVCGATNPFVDLATDYPQINIEQVLIANPQLIIQPISNGVAPPDAIEWQKFKQINAAKHQQILHPNSDILHRMSFRLISELAHLCAGIDASRHFYLQTSTEQTSG